MWPWGNRTKILGEVDLDRYQRRRDILHSHQMAASQTISRKAYLRCSEDLGLRKPGTNTIIFESDAELVILTNFCLYADRQRGKTPMAKYLANLPEVEDPEEQIVRKAMAHARFTVVEAQQIQRGTGIEAYDLVYGELLPIVDRAFSRSVRKGWHLAGHFLQLPEYWMTTGAAFPVTETVADLVRLAPPAQIATPQRSRGRRTGPAGHQHRLGRRHDLSGGVRVNEYAIAITPRRLRSEPRAELNGVRRYG